MAHRFGSKVLGGSTFLLLLVAVSISDVSKVQAHEITPSTLDGAGLTGTIAVETCPEVPPIQSPVVASSTLHCEYGQECCCGACAPSLVCSAEAGEMFRCYNTDFCLRPCPVPAAPAGPLALVLAAIGCGAVASRRSVHGA
jgi:hypothetical protein